MRISVIENGRGLQRDWANDRQRAVQTIEDEFYRIMDRIDIQLSPMSKSANRITQRMLGKGKTMANVKRYINNLITESFALPTRGQYATEPNTIQNVLDKQNALFDAYFEWANRN
jgi:hypothetical protein